MRRSRTAVAVAVGAVTTLVLAACGGGGQQGGTGGGADEAALGVFAECTDDVTACNTVPPEELQQGGQITYALEQNIPNWNLNSAEGNLFAAGTTLRTILPATFTSTPDFEPTMNEDLLVSAEQTGDEPQTIVYEIAPDAVWNDGTPITADDFAYNWRVRNGEDCPDCANAGTQGYDQVASVEGSNEGRTVTVTYETPFADWRVLWSGDAPLYPAHIAAEQGDLNTPDGLAAAFEYFGATVPDYSAGPYQIEEWQDNVALTTVPNPQWYGETQPALDRIIYRIITDATQAPIALQNNEVQVIYPQPQVDLVQQVTDMPGVSQWQSLGLTWEHFDFNLNNEFLADRALRQAMFTAVNRQDLIDSTVGQFNDEVEPLNNHNFVPGVDGYEDVVSQTGQGSGDIEVARQILADAGYTGAEDGGQLTSPDGEAVPPLRIRYTTGNTLRQSQSELFAQYVAPLGVDITIDPTDALGTTLDTGDYDIMVFAWVASPYPFSGGVQLWTTGSGSNYGDYSNPEVDRLITEAATSTDRDAAVEALNESNRIMAEDAYVLPLYQKPTFIAVQDTVANVRDNATLDSPTYNVAEWGLRSQ